MLEISLKPADPGIRYIQESLPLPCWTPTIQARQSQPATLTYGTKAGSIWPWHAFCAAFLKTVAGAILLPGLQR